MSDWLDRAAVLALLRVKPQTLYAYVSRGLIEVRREPGMRRSLYRAADAMALADRQGRSRRPAAIAAGSMAWGEGSIATSIATVHRGRLVYRGRDAALFAQDATLEDAARLLWDVETVTFAVPQSAASTAFSALAALVPQSQASLGRGRERLRRDAQVAIGHLAAACGLPPGTAPLHQGLAGLWRVDRHHADLLRKGLVLIADHELNASTFACRVAASTGAPIAACLLAGLSALSGPRHGGASAALQRLVEEAGDSPSAAVRAWLDRYGDLPGFGHPLYPDGDLRAAVLLADLPPNALMRDLAACAQEVAGLRPNIDFALTALSRSAGMPADAPFTIFLLGRSIGWAAHAMEQAQQRDLIRPRGRYEGPLPRTDN